MEVKNCFSQNEIESYSKQIYTLINEEPALTKRKLNYLKKWLSNQAIYVTVDKNRVIGFIIKEPLAANYYELKSWYIIPSLRNTEKSKQILKKALYNNNHHYIAVTFKEDIVDRLKPLGFIKISWQNLPIKILLKYILTRSIKSIIYHYFVKKSCLLYKK